MKLKLQKKSLLEELLNIRNIKKSAKLWEKDIVNILIEKAYKKLLQRNKDKQNEFKDNIKKIAISDEYSVTDKVKEIYRELIKKPIFIFNNLFSLEEKPKAEVVTAFTGVLELSRRNKVLTQQEELFGDIIISKKKRNLDGNNNIAV